MAWDTLPGMPPFGVLRDRFGVWWMFHFDQHAAAGA